MTPHPTPRQKHRLGPLCKLWDHAVSIWAHRAETRREYRETREENERLAVQAHRLVRYVVTHQAEIALDFIIGEYMYKYGRENTTVTDLGNGSTRLEIVQHSADGDQLVTLVLSPRD